MAIGATFTVPNTFVAGNTAMAADVNADFAAIIANLDPSGVGSYVANASEMQTNSDPYPSDTEAIPASLLVYIRQLQWQIKALTRTDQWYKDPWKVVAKTGAYTATSNDHFIDCDATSATFAITIPAASSALSGKEFVITKTDVSTNAVTLAGGFTASLRSQYSSITIKCNGSVWMDNKGGLQTIKGGDVGGTLTLGDNESGQSWNASILFKGSNSATPDKYFRTFSGRLEILANDGVTGLWAIDNDGKQRKPVTIAPSTDTQPLILGDNEAGRSWNASILFKGTGGAAPNKYLRAFNSQLEILANDGTTGIVVISDTGVMTLGTVPLARMMRTEVQGSGTTSVALNLGTVVTGDRILVTGSSSATSGGSIREIRMIQTAGGATTDIGGRSGATGTWATLTDLSEGTISGIFRVTTGGTLTITVDQTADSGQATYAHAIVLNNG